MLYHGKIYFEKYVIQLEFERIFQKKIYRKRKFTCKSFALACAGPILPYPVLGTGVHQKHLFPGEGQSARSLSVGCGVGRRMERLWVERSFHSWRSKRPHNCRCGVSKKGQALLIAVSGVWAAAEEVCDRDRRSHVWEDGDPAEAAGGDDGRCTRSRE